jgi:hypothetical protein
MRTLLVLVIALSALLLACGGGDDDSDDTDSNGNGAEATATENGGDEPSDAAEPSEGGDEPTDAPDDGGGDGDGSGEGACGLVTKSEVEEAFGASMLDPELIPLPDTPIAGGAVASVESCSFVSNEVVDSFSLSLTTAADAESAIQSMIDLACQNKEEISGLGDKACWYSEAHTEIQVKVGANFLDLFVTTVEGDSSAITSGLAEIAVGRAQ